MIASSTRGHLKGLANSKVALLCAICKEELQEIVRTGHIDRELNHIPSFLAFNGQYLGRVISNHGFKAAVLGVAKEDFVVANDTITIDINAPELICEIGRQIDANGRDSRSDDLLPDHIISEFLRRHRDFNRPFDFVLFGNV